jgi:hypothetical protein
MDIGKSKDVAEREEQGTIIYVKDENGEPDFNGEGDSRKQTTITVVGTYSKTFRRSRERQREKNLKRGRGALTVEVLAKQETEVLAECILGWDGFMSDGKPFHYSKENAVLLLEAAPWIREQVEEAMADHQGFSTARSQS